MLGERGGANTAKVGAAGGNMVGGAEKHVEARVWNGAEWVWELWYADSVMPVLRVLTLFAGCRNDLNVRHLRKAKGYVGWINCPQRYPHSVSDTIFTSWSPLPPSRSASL